MFHLTAAWNRNEQRIGAWASIIGLVIVVVGLLTPLPLAESIKEKIYASGLVLVSIGGAMTFLVATVRSGRKARHAEAAASIREAVRRIAAEGLNEFHSISERKHVLVGAMDDLAKAFSIVTGSDCRCCVKYVTLEKEEFVAKTLCRNGGCEGQEKSHPIEHNTDFGELFHKTEMQWYFGNDLPDLAKSGRYHNTAVGWHTRYRSTIVWPIGRERPDNAEAPDLLGFLCVDSKRKRPFSEEYDYPLGAVVADVLCPFMMKISDSLKELPLRPKDFLAPDAVATTQDVAQPDGKTAARARGKRAES